MGTIREEFVVEIWVDFGTAVRDGVLWRLPLDTPCSAENIREVGGLKAGRRVKFTDGDLYVVGKTVRGEDGKLFGVYDPDNLDNVTYEGLQGDLQEAWETLTEGPWRNVGSPLDHAAWKAECVLAEHPDCWGAMAIRAIVHCLRKEKREAELLNKRAWGILPGHSLYSLALFWEGMLTGPRPFRIESVGEALHLLSEEKAVEGSPLREAVWTEVGRLWAKDRKARGVINSFIEQGEGDIYKRAEMLYRVILSERVGNDEATFRMVRRLSRHECTEMRRAATSCLHVAVLEREDAVEVARERLKEDPPGEHGTYDVRHVARGVLEPVRGRYKSVDRELKEFDLWWDSELKGQAGRRGEGNGKVDAGRIRKPAHL